MAPFNRHDSSCSVRNFSMLLCPRSTCAQGFSSSCQICQAELCLSCPGQCSHSTCTTWHFRLPACPSVPFYHFTIPRAKYCDVVLLWEYAAYSDAEGEGDCWPGYLDHFLEKQQILEHPCHAHTASPAGKHFHIKCESVHSCIK